MYSVSQDAVTRYHGRHHDLFITYLGINQMQHIGFFDSVSDFFSRKTATQQCSPIQIAIAETNGKLRLNETAVVNLTGTVAAKKGMFVCAPLQESGIDGLRECYQTIFQVAADDNVKLLSVPTFSTGFRGYSHEEAAKVAIKAACDFLESNAGLDLHIIFVVYQSEDKTSLDQSNADAYQHALNHFQSSANAESKRLSCVKSQIQYLPADMVVIPVDIDFQASGAVYQAITNAIIQNESCTAITTYILPSSPEVEEKSEQDSTWPLPAVLANVAFVRRPLQYGHRGDSRLWDKLHASLALTYLPKDEVEFETLIVAKFRELTGKGLGTDFFASDLNYGGMSGGSVNGQFWTKQGLPWLLMNFKEVQREQQLLAQKVSALIAGRSDPGSLVSDLPKDITSTIGLVLMSAFAADLSHLKGWSKSTDFELKYIEDWDTLTAVPKKNSGHFDK